MIFHNIYTMTIGRYMEMDESKNNRLILTIPIFMPRKFIVKAQIKLNTAFNKSVNISDVVNILDESTHKQSLAIRTDILIPALYRAFDLHYILYGKISQDEDLQRGYRSICDKNAETREDIDYLLRKQEQLIDIFKTEYPEKKQPSETISLTTLVQRLEFDMPHPVNRDAKLYELAGYIELVKKKRQRDGRN